MAYIIIYLLYMAYINIISGNKSKNQTIWTQEFLRGNPVTGEKTKEASLTPKFTLLVSTLAEATTPYNLLYQSNAGKRTKTLFIQLLVGTNRKGLQPLQAYSVGPSTTLPPCNDKIERRRERLKTDSVQALLTTVNMTVSKWETHFDWQTPQDKWKTKENSDKTQQTSKEQGKASKQTRSKHKAMNKRKRMPKYG